MIVQLNNLFTTQRKIERKDQIPEIIKAIKNGDYINPVLISEIGYNLYRIEDGTHRATAYLLSGRDVLEYGEFEIVPFNKSRPTLELLFDLVNEIFYIE